MLARVCGTSQRLRTNGKPLESALLGSLFIVHGLGLACQVKQGNGVRRMAISEVGDVSLMAFDQYMRQVRWIAPLTEEEEACLVVCVERGKVEHEHLCPDAEVLEEARRARDRLVEGLQWLVIGVAKRYQRYCKSMELADLIQEGNIGLLKAIERNDARSGYPLRFLASRCIRDTICAALWNCDRQVRVSRWVYEMLGRMRKIEHHLRDMSGREPSLLEVAEQMGESEDYLRELIELEQRASGVSSLQALLAEDDAEARVDFVSLFATAVAVEKTRGESLEGVIQQAMETALTDRQREVVRLRYGLGGRCHSQAETNALLGMKGKNSAQRIEYRAKERLREVLTPASTQLQERLVG
jgi:RNA polymerase primary sigma factor